jgi:hypothetical protein
MRLKKKNKKQTTRVNLGYTVKDVTHVMWLGYSRGKQFETNYEDQFPINLMLKDKILKNNF